MFMNHCRLCNGREALNKTNISIENGRDILYECKLCGGLFANSRLASDDSRVLYDHLFSAGDYEYHRREFDELVLRGTTYAPYRKLLFNKIAKQLPGKNIIEIGGGIGSFGKFVKDKGYEYKDLDIAGSALEFVGNLGLNYELIDSENLDTLKIVDADLVVMWEVIEHIWDVAVYLRRIYEGLNYNGGLVLSTPNIYRRGYLDNVNKPSISSPPIHINFFSEVSLRYCLEQAGFTDIKFYKKRIESPVRSMAGIKYSLEIFLGLAPLKSIYCFAKKS